MSKAFASKSLDHLGSYSLVQSTKSFVLSYKYAAILATYSIALINFTQDNVVAKFPYALDLLQFSDAKFDSLVLSNVDAVLASDYYSKAENVLVASKENVGNVVNAYKVKGAQIYSALISRVQVHISPLKEQVSAYANNAQSILGEYKKKGEDTVSVYLKPINDFASSTIDKVLPKSKKVAEDAKASAETELAKSIEIVNDTYERSKDLIASKSNEVTSAVLSTYHKEFDSTPEKNYYVKVASASVNTGVALLKNVNSDYIQPLKETTQNYVQETITHADDKAGEHAAEAKKAVENVSKQLNGSSNGTIPVVSASA
ncbi:hypothetical protein JCM33374_g4271 [Metschnikowia sp. JCM 33374]|nr:hypothetical protein JCM33374_g4271 [Metschnikowia sp. JCM 33374]